jgi:hypothetical protein
MLVGASVHNVSRVDEIRKAMTFGTSATGRMNLPGAPAGALYCLWLSRLGIAQLGGLRKGV